MSNIRSGAVEPDSSPEARLHSRVLWVVSSLIMLDSNIVAVSLPTIGRAIGASFSDIQ
jgi:hypothetical protein